MEKDDYYCFVQWVTSLISSFALAKLYAIVENIGRGDGGGGANKLKPKIEQSTENHHHKKIHGFDIKTAYVYIDYTIECRMQRAGEAV